METPQEEKTIKKRTWKKYRNSYQVPKYLLNHVSPKIPLISLISSEMVSSLINNQQKYVIAFPTKNETYSFDYIISNYFKLLCTHGKEFENKYFKKKNNNNGIQFNLPNYKQKIEKIEDIEISPKSYDKSLKTLTTLQTGNIININNVKYKFIEFNNYQNKYSIKYRELNSGALYHTITYDSIPIIEKDDNEYKIFNDELSYKEFIFKKNTSRNNTLLKNNTTVFKKISEDDKDIEKKLNILIQEEKK